MVAHLPGQRPADQDAKPVGQGDDRQETGAVDLRRHLRLVEELLEVEAARLPVADGALLVEALRLADAFVLPSLSEGLPMTVLEAWAYAKPALITLECNVSEGFAAGAIERRWEPADGLW